MSPSHGLGDQAVAGRAERRRDPSCASRRRRGPRREQRERGGAPTPIARNGSRGAGTGRVAMSAMGSHLPGKVQAGRWRVRSRRPGPRLDSRETAPGTGPRGWRAADARSGLRWSCDLPSRDRRRGRVGLGGHGDAHRGERVVQPGLGRPERDAQRRRHLRQRHPEQVVQGDDRAMAGIEAPERLVDQLAVGQRAAT